MAMENPSGLARIYNSKMSLTQGNIPGQTGSSHDQEISYEREYCFDLYDSGTQHEVSDHVKARVSDTIRKRTLSPRADLFM